MSTLVVSMHREPAVTLTIQNLEFIKYRCGKVGTEHSSESWTQPVESVGDLLGEVFLDLIDTGNLFSGYATNILGALTLVGAARLWLQRNALTQSVEPSPDEISLSRFHESG